MYKLEVNSQNLSELVESITWTGDTKQVARKLSFSLVQNATDKHIPKLKIAEGDKVQFYDDKGSCIFNGVLMTSNKKASSNTISYNATDYMYYINESEISKVYESTPEQITSLICADLGIPFGGAVATGIKVYLPVIQKKAYEAILMAYTAASRQNGKKYIPLIKDTNKVAVIEKGLFSGVLLDADYNLQDADYNTSLEKLVNKVIITDKSGNTVKIIQDITSQRKYGTVQKVIKQEDGKDVATEAQAMLKELESTASVIGVSDFRAVSGYSIAIREPYTGLVGRFFIESDSHNFANGKREMQLTLAFDNLMDEKDIPKEDKK